jgi:EAL domain-containing protein (putative c-di-GMP-specific phosphodiesterase class I)
MGMLDDADDLGIVAGVIQLAAVFKRQVIAEGVETMAHGMALRKLGCSLVQGYGIAGRCRHKHCRTGYGSGSSRRPGSNWIRSGHLKR